MRDDGDKKCKICKEVSAPARTTLQEPPPPPPPDRVPPTVDSHTPHPRFHTQVLPTSKFSPAQLRKPRAACKSCCESRAQDDRPDHVPRGKSTKERREELRRLRETKRKERDGVNAEPATSAMPKRADEPAAKRVKPSEPDGGDDERRPAGGGNDERPFVTKGDEPASAAEGDETMKRQIYVGGIPFYKTEDEIREAFDNENLPVESIDCMTFPDSGRFRGIAIVTFATAEAAEGALAWNNEEWEGKFLVVRKYAPKDGATKAVAAKEDATPREEVKKTEGQTIAFIANLDYSVTEEQLRTALVGCEVKEVRMGKDKETDEFKGFAHVEFVGDDDLEQAVSLSGTNLMGREMKIAYATARKPPKEDRAPPRFGEKKRGKRDMRHKGDFKKIRRAKRG